MQNNAALITGGGVRLGKLIALSLANVGWDIALHYNNSEVEAKQTQKEILNLGRKCEIFKFDFNLISREYLVDHNENLNENLYDNFLVKVINIFPNLTLLINNAAFYKASNIENCKLLDYDKLMNINLRAPIFLSKAFYRITNNYYKKLSEDIKNNTETISPDVTINDIETISPDVTINDTETISPDITINDSMAISPDVTINDIEANSSDVTINDSKAISPDVTINDIKAISPDVTIKNNTETLLLDNTLKEKSTLSIDKKFSEHFHSYNKNFNIINILDTKINSNTFPYFAYVLTKKALGEFTKMAALEFGKKVRVNAVAPNMVIPIEDHERTGEYLDWMKEAIPLKSYPEFENIFLAIKYLIENNYVTGEILHVDGGEGINFITRNFESFKNK